MSCAGCSNSFGNPILDKIKDKYVDGYHKLGTFDWMNELPDSAPEIKKIVEVRFKNTRKGFYRNDLDLKLKKGDKVSVEASPGHDVGVVSLTGYLAYAQFKRKNKYKKYEELQTIYRFAKSSDLDKQKEAKKLETPTMIKARKLAKELDLDMKIGDVEYQGDNSKAIFYYIADKRVDFRELIKKYAMEFKVRIEMKQIGSRQEAGLIGGIGSCGRELCCSTWRTDFSSITTAFAKIQELPLNAQKLAGQCGKLKCCLTYELDHYIEARKDFPNQLLELETEKGIAYPFKVDILKKLIWYSFKKDAAVDLKAVDLDRFKEVLLLNKKGVKVKKLVEEASAPNEPEMMLGDLEPLEKRYKKKRPKKKRKNRQNSNFVTK